MGSVWWPEGGKQCGWGVPKLPGSVSPEMCEDVSVPAMPNISDDVPLGDNTALGTGCYAGAATQSGLSSPQNGVATNLLTFSQGKCKVLPLGWAKPVQLGRPGLWGDGSIAEKALCLQQTTSRTSVSRVPLQQRQPDSSWSGLAKGSHQLEGAFVRPR